LSDPDKLLGKIKNFTSGALDPLPESGFNCFSLFIVIFVHFVARSFCVKIKFPKEMPKIAKCLKCLKLRYSIDLIKRKKQGMRLYSFTDFWFFMLKIPGVYNKDGAKRRHNFRHFRHFSSL
jgi:hypothetical protein